VYDFVNRIAHVLFRIVGFIMRLAPLGAFGAMAFTIGKYGLGTLKSLGLLMACFYATCLIFIFVVLGLIARAHGFSIFRFVRYLRDELLIVLGTSSSESVLPRMLSKMESAGAAKPVVGLVIPTGYSFNLDGTSIYLTMAAVFIAQATNTPMTLLDQLTLLAVLLLTSKGAAGVTGRVCMEFIEQLARRRGLNLLWLTVNKGNPAVKAYERLGFRIAADLVMDIGGGFVMDDYRMEKSLL
jgi:aerobic C4-dicarboxylate transport protein